MNDITPQQAREQLARAEAATTHRDGDRRVHALATAGFGLLIGGYLAASRISEDTSWETVVLAFYVLLLIALTTWQAKGARTWPRHARRLNGWGVAGTMALFFAGVIGFNVVEAEQKIHGVPPTDNIPLLLLAGLVVATPMLVSARLIGRGDRA